MKLETTRARFFNKILVGPNGCWTWKGAHTPDGYGKFKSFGETLAHRVSFRLFKGDISKGLVVMHACDNRECVNPEHLSLGTWDLNNKDRAAKGRNNHVNDGKTHCKRGHEFNEANTYYRKTGARMCRPCAVIYQRERKLK